MYRAHPLEVETAPLWSEQPPSGRNSPPLVGTAPLLVGTAPLWSEQPPSGRNSPSSGRNSPPLVGTAPLWSEQPPPGRNIPPLVGTAPFLGGTSPILRAVIRSYLGTNLSTEAINACSTRAFFPTTCRRQAFPGTNNSSKRSTWAWPVPCV